MKVDAMGRSNGHSPCLDDWVPKVAALCTGADGQPRRCPAGSIEMAQCFLANQNAFHGRMASVAPGYPWKPGNGRSAHNCSLVRPMSLLDRGLSPTLALDLLFVGMEESADGGSSGHAC